MSFPAGAGSGVYGRIDGDEVSLTGRGSFATGAAYGDWCGVVFAVADEHGKRLEPLDLRFSMVRNDSHGVRIDPTWDGSGLRASATDDIHYDDVRVPLDRCVPWFGANRAESLRVVPVINHRYREDWVGISDLMLGWMAVGVTRRALAEIADESRTRKAIMGTKMVERPTVQVNLGEAMSLIASARAAVTEACHEVDRRIEQRTIPDTADYFRQQAIVSMAVDQLSQRWTCSPVWKAATGCERAERLLDASAISGRCRCTSTSTVIALPTRSAGLRSASIWMPSDRRVKISP